MKKLLFVLTLLFFCWGCEDDELVVDDNLIGVWESQPQNFNIQCNDCTSVVHSLCGMIDTVMFGYNIPFRSLEFSYPNNYIIYSSVCEEEEISSGTFFNEGNKIFFNGNFKQSIFDSQGHCLVTQNIENIDFNCGYTTSDSLLNLYEIEVCSTFEIITDIQLPHTLWGGDCPLVFNNSSLQHYMNNYPLRLSDLGYNKIN